MHSVETDKSIAFWHSMVQVSVIKEKLKRASAMRMLSMANLSASKFTMLHYLYPAKDTQNNLNVM